MGLIVGILVLCFFIGLFNLVMRVCFGIGWCIWKLAKAALALIVIILFIAALCNC